MHKTPTGMPNLLLNTLTFQGECIQSPISSESPPRDTGPDPIAFLTLLLDYMCVFLTDLVVQESFTNFQLVFHENCSTYRYIFDVFMMRM